MTKNYNLGEVETKPLVLRRKWNEEKQKYEDDFSLIKTRVDWVSNGNYAVWQNLDDFQIREASKFDKLSIFPYIWVELEADYFDQILEALANKPLPTTAVELFEPFWQAVLPPRGMHFYETQLRAYFWGKHRKGFILHQQHSRTDFNYPSNRIKEMGFNAEDFKKIRDVALSSDKSKPLQYCTVTW